MVLYCYNPYVAAQRAAFPQASINCYHIIANSFVKTLSFNCLPKSKYVVCAILSLEMIIRFFNKKKKSSCNMHNKNLIFRCSIQL